MNNVKKLSRGTEIDVQKCVKNVGGNRFELVLIAAERARELSKQHIRKEATHQVNAPVTALLEIQSGSVGREYLSKIRQ